MYRRRYAHAEQNLRLYLSQAVLPRMSLGQECPPVPQDTEVASNEYLLSSEPDSRRKLKMVLLFQRSLMVKRIINYLVATIPGEPIVEIGRCLWLRAPSFFFRPFRSPSFVNDMKGMSEWVLLPLETAQHAMRLVWPGMKRFGITEDSEAITDNPDDAQIYKTYYLQQIHGVNTEDVHQSPFKVTIAAIAPWAISGQELQDFVRVGEFPAFSIRREQGNYDKLNEKPSFQRVHKVWAKLWDDCTRKRCPFFIVSIYDLWLFGVFTRGWTMAVVSEPIKRTDKRPSIVQWLVYWFASAMGFPGSWRPPLIPRFENPDIANVDNVATRLAPEWPNAAKVTTHERWLKRHHHHEGTRKTARTVKMNNLEATWITKFGRQI